MTAGRAPSGLALPRTTSTRRHSPPSTLSPRFMRLLSVLVLVPAVLTAQAQPPRPVYRAGALTPSQQLARDIYKQLIEVNTAVTTGNVTTASVALAQRFRAGGIPESDILVGGPRPEKHNVVARLRGRNPQLPPVLLLAHLDVVEALKADWSNDLDPFVFTE